MPDLTELGWDDTLAEQFETFAAAGLVPGRGEVRRGGEAGLEASLRGVNPPRGAAGHPPHSCAAPAVRPDFLA